MRLTRLAARLSVRQLPAFRRNAPLLRPSSHPYCQRAQLLWGGAPEDGRAPPPEEGAHPFVNAWLMTIALAEKASQYTTKSIQVILPVRVKNSAVASPHQKL